MVTRVRGIPWSSFMSGAADMPTQNMPTKTEEPSVTYVSLTGDFDNLFSNDDGHRFLVLQAHGYVRVVQACNGV
jgi:hypothetical protein